MLTCGNSSVTEFRLLIVDEWPGHQSPVLPLTWSSFGEAQTAWAADWDGQHWWVAPYCSLHHPSVHLCNSSSIIQIHVHTILYLYIHFICYLLAYWLHVLRWCLYVPHVLMMCNTWMLTYVFSSEVLCSPLYDFWFWQVAYHQCSWWIQ